MQDCMLIVKIAIAKLMFGGIKLPRKKKEKPKKIKVRAPNKEYFQGGGKTKCALCKRIIPLMGAWQCCYAEKYETVSDLKRGIMKVTKKEIDTDIQEVVEEDGES